MNSRRSLLITSAKVSAALIYARRRPRRIVNQSRASQFRGLLRTRNPGRLPIPSIAGRPSLGPVDGRDRPARFEAGEGVVAAAPPGEFTPRHGLDILR